MRTNDGMTLRGGTPEEVVAELRGASRTPTVDDAEFMAKTASRAMDETGREVRFDTAAHFVEDLVAAGLIKE